MSRLIMDDVEFERRVERLDSRYRSVSRLLDLAHDEYRAIAATGSNAVHLTYAQNRIFQLTHVRDTVRAEIHRLENRVSA